MSPSRRGFLRQASGLMAAGVLTRTPGHSLWTAAPKTFLPEPNETLLRELASTAVDAARTAGAGFADVRLTVARALALAFHTADTGHPVMSPPSLDRRTGYGIRVVVDGVWGFASDVELTPEAVARAARKAVMAARATPPRRARALDLAPMPRVTDGAWATPIAQDPFAVPIQEQAELGLATLAEIGKGGELSFARVGFEWRRPISVFAATDGSMIVQHLTLACPRVTIRASRAFMDLDLPVGGYGYEALGASTLGSRMRQAAERAVGKVQAARTASSVEVGRYDIVLGAPAVATLLVQTVADAVNAERALGYRANAAGTSYAGPPAEVLGTYRIGSELLNVRADRSQPHGAATVGWDDEGVRPDDHTIVRDGVVVDYHTSRETAVELADWYRRQGAAVRSHGCFRRMATSRPAVYVPNLTVVPGPDATSVEDLIADTKRGLYVEHTQGSADQQLLSAQFWSERARVRRIVNGKLGDYVNDMAFQFTTPAFWKGLDALGGGASVERTAVVTDVAATLDTRQAFPYSTVRAVPVRIRQVNVLNTGRRA